MRHPAPFGLPAFAPAAPAPSVTLVSFDPSNILRRLAGIDRKLLVHDLVLRDIYRKLQPLLSPPPGRPRREIGFHVK